MYLIMLIASSPLSLEYMEEVGQVLSSLGKLYYIILVMLIASRSIHPPYELLIL